MTDFWRNNKRLEHITPPGTEWPEQGLPEALDSIIGNDTVFEFGCGYGRLATLFNPVRYTGYDINPYALQAARKRLPVHRFTDSWRIDEPSTVCLAYTVLLHIPDDAIGAVLGHMSCYERLVIGEIMGRKWRRDGEPRVFNREVEDYEALLGRKASTVVQVPYTRYADTQATLLVFE